MARNTGKIATPFPLPRRRSEADAQGDTPEPDTPPPLLQDEVPPPPSDDTNIELDPKLTGYFSEHGDTGPDTEPSSETNLIKVEKSLEGTSSHGDTPLITGDVPSENSCKESWDNYSYPSQLVLHCERSPSPSRQSSPSSSSDSEPDSPIPSFSPSESDGSFKDYADFMSHFRILVKTRAELVFKLDDYFSQSLIFPSQLDLSDWNVPEVVTSKTLKTLKISVPKSICNTLKLPTTAGPVDPDGNNIAQYDEQVLCEKVLFLLRKIQSFNLRNFIFFNDCDGAKVGKMSRIALWSNRLERFLNRHSYSLEKIAIRSVMNHSVAKYFPLPGEEEGPFKGRVKFPHISDLELVFWPPSNNVEKFENGEPWLKNFWVQLLRSRERVGQLSRLVWMCPYSFSFIEVWNPILEYNKETLKVLHILVSDSPVPMDKGESLKMKTYNFISCSYFVGLTKLESLYLKNSLCLLQKLDLLPITLTELALDGLCLESKEIIAAFKKLTNLRKLRLVDTRFDLISLKYYSFGVDFEVIKGILNHRKLDEVLIWGYTLTQKKRRKIIPEPPKKLEPVNPPRRSRSKFQNLKDIYSAFKSELRSRAEMRKAAWEAQPDLKSIEEDLRKIGTVDENSITIK